MMKEDGWAIKLKEELDQIQQQKEDLRNEFKNLNEFQKNSDRVSYEGKYRVLEKLQGEVEEKIRVSSHVGEVYGK